MTLTTHARRWQRRDRRRRRRGRMIPSDALRVSTRNRWAWWPVTRKVTRWHRYEWMPKPRCKSTEYRESED